MKNWPLYFTIIRRLLAGKRLTPVSPGVIDIIGDGWRQGLSALAVVKLITAHEFELDEEARNAAHDG